MTPPNVSDDVRRAWANELQLDPVPLPDGAQPDRPWVAGREGGVEGAPDRREHLTRGATRAQRRGGTVRSPVIWLTYTFQR